MEFLTIFGKVLAKNRAFGNNIFIQQFFTFRWGGSPGYATDFSLFILNFCIIFPRINYLIIFNNKGII